MKRSLISFSILGFFSIVGLLLGGKLVESRSQIAAKRETLNLTNHERTRLEKLQRSREGSLKEKRNELKTVLEISPNEKINQLENKPGVLKPGEWKEGPLVAVRKELLAKLSPSDTAWSPDGMQWNEDSFELLGIDDQQKGDVKNAFKEVLKDFRDLECRYIRLAGSEELPAELKNPHPKTTYVIPALPDEGNGLRARLTENWTQKVGATRAQLLMEYNQTWIDELTTFFGSRTKYLSFLDPFEQNPHGSVAVLIEQDGFYRSLVYGLNPNELVSQLAKPHFDHLVAKDGKGWRIRGE